MIKYQGIYPVYINFTSKHAPCLSQMGFAIEQCLYLYEQHSVYIVNKLTSMYEYRAIFRSQNVSTLIVSKVFKDKKTLIFTSISKSIEQKVNRFANGQHNKAGGVCVRVCCWYKCWEYVYEICIARKRETQTERISSSSTFNYIVNCANLPDDDMQIMNLSMTIILGDTFNMHTHCHVQHVLQQMAVSYWVLSICLLSYTTHTSAHTHTHTSKRKCF